MKPKIRRASDELFQAIYVLKEPLLEKYATACPQILHHYTSPEACFAILEPSRRRLWATSILRQNDTSEMAFSSLLIGRIAQKVFPKAQAWMLEMGKRPDLRENMTVVSFCGKADLLSQWRAYGQSGGGCAIGFNPRSLSSTARGYMLRPVVYEPKAQKSFIEEVLLEIVQLAKRYEAPHPELFAFVSAAVLAPWLKHPSSAEEQEWRLVGETNRLKFRATNVGVVPYSEMSLDKKCVKELWLGPVSDVRMNTKAWKLFLDRKFGRKKAGTPLVKLRTSAIPLRRLDRD